MSATKATTTSRGVTVFITKRHDYYCQATVLIYLIIIHRVYLCLNVSIYNGQVVYNPTVGSSITPWAGRLQSHGRIVYNPTVGFSTTPRSGRLQPHGRVVYNHTVGSSTTPRSGRLHPHGRIVYNPKVRSSQ